MDAEAELGVTCAAPGPGSGTQTDPQRVRGQPFTRPLCQVISLPVLRQDAKVKG